jgi:hypothetical protein
MSARGDSIGDISLPNDTGPLAPRNARCPVCDEPHSAIARCERLRQVALSLDLFGVPAFLTDPLNRFVWVNSAFAQLIGDPIKDSLPPNIRFLPTAVIGSYRDRFPRRMQEVAQCVQGLSLEVRAGRLMRQTLGLLQDTFSLDEDLLRLARKTDSEWDGTMVIKGGDSKMQMIREQVVPIANPQGSDSGFHISASPTAR